MKKIFKWIADSLQYTLLYLSFIWLVIKSRVWEYRGRFALARSTRLNEKAAKKVFVASLAGAKMKLIGYEMERRIKILDSYL